MSELILKTGTLPESDSSDIIDEMYGMFSDGKMSVEKYQKQKNAEKELEGKTGNDDCPLRGLAADSELTVDKFLAMTHDEKEMLL